MKKRTKVIAIAFSLALLTLGGLASIPAGSTILAGKAMLADDTDTDDPETDPETDSDGNDYALSREYCTHVWICPNGTIQLTSGRAFTCVESTGSRCTSADESSCDASKPDCLRF